MASANPSRYQHDMDIQTLDALRSLPGFLALLNAFTTIYNEQAVVARMKSTYLQITPHQLSEYYEMLPPICERLGIDIPVLCLANDPRIDACTINEGFPVIVISAGVLEKCSDETIGALLAHECGHIACHHVLYQMLGKLITSGTAPLLLNLCGQADVDMRSAYLAWNKASELTADRAAAIAMGSAESVRNMCIELAGGWEFLDFEVNRQCFLNQAEEYMTFISEGSTNTVFEAVVESVTGPCSLNAYRALALERWCRTDEYKEMLSLLDEGRTEVEPLELEALGEAGGQPAEEKEEIEEGEESKEVKAEKAEEPIDREVEEIEGFEEGEEVEEAIDDEMGEEILTPAEQPVVMFCENCGTPVKRGQVFCALCGNRCE